MKRYLFFILLTLITTSCSSSNEDPTNIELEVLRASLLDKEFEIDDLRETIDEYNDSINKLNEEIDVKNKTIEENYVLRQRLLENQPQELQLVNDNEIYFEIDEQDVFMLYQFNDLNIGYSYESLYSISKTENKTVEREIYRGKDIIFNVDKHYNDIYLYDMKNLLIIDYYGKYQTRYELKNDLKMLGDITSTMLTTEIVLVETSNDETDEDIDNTDSSEIIDNEEDTDVNIDVSIEGDINDNEEDTNSDNLDTSPSESEVEDGSDELIVEESEPEISDSILYDEITIIHCYFLETKTTENTEQFLGVYKVTYNGNEYSIEKLPMPEYTTNPTNPYFMDNKLYYADSETEQVVEFDLNIKNEETF